MWYRVGIALYLIRVYSDTALFRYTLNRAYLTTNYDGINESIIQLFNNLFLHYILHRKI